MLNPEGKQKFTQRCHEQQTKQFIACHKEQSDTFQVFDMLGL